MNEKLPMYRAVAALLLPLVAHAGAAHAGDTLVDPMRPINATAEVHHAEDALRVEAIFSRDGRRVAIVGGKVVRAGDRLSWGQVQEVTATGIRYVAAGRIQFMALQIPKLQVRRVSASQGETP